MQDNEGQGDFCRTISTLNEGPCRKIKKKTPKYRRIQCGEYRVPVHTHIKKTKVTSIAMKLYSEQRQPR